LIKTLVSLQRRQAESVLAMVLRMKLIEKNIKDSYMVEQASPSVQRISTLGLWIPALFKLKKIKIAESKNES